MAEGHVALTKAQALYDGNRADEALREIGPALADPQTSARGYGLQALCLAGVGQVDGALRAARTSQGAAPLDDFGYRIEGLIRVNHRKGAGAIKPAREAVRLDPSLMNQYVLVHALRDKRQREEAYSIASGLAATHPQTPMAIDALGICELRARNWSAAESLYRQAVALAPHEPLYTTRLGEALQGQGRTAEATEAYLASARSDPTNTDHRRKLATAGVKVGTAGGIGALAIILKLGALGAANTAVRSGGGNSRASFAGALTVFWAFIVIVFSVALVRAWIHIRHGAALLEPELRAALAPDRRRGLGRVLGAATTSLTPLAVIITVVDLRIGWVCLAASLAVVALAYALTGREAFAMPRWLRRLIPLGRP